MTQIYEVCSEQQGAELPQRDRATTFVSYESRLQLILQGCKAADNLRNRCLRLRQKQLYKMFRFKMFAVGIDCA